MEVEDFPALCVVSGVYGVFVWLLAVFMDPSAVKLDKGTVEVLRADGNLWVMCVGRHCLGHP